MPSLAAPRRMSAELGPAVIAFVALACLVAGFGHGALGFGFPIVATPLVALAIDIKSAIALLAPITLLLTVISALRGVALSSIVREYWFLPLATALGAWLGTRILLAVSPEPFLLVLAGVILLYLNLHPVGRGPSAPGQRVPLPLRPGVRLRRGGMRGGRERRRPDPAHLFHAARPRPRADRADAEPVLLARQGRADRDLGDVGRDQPARLADDRVVRRAFGRSAFRRHARAQPHRRADVPALAARGAVDHGGAAARPVLDARARDGRGVVARHRAGRRSRRAGAGARRRARRQGAQCRGARAAES